MSGTFLSLTTLRTILGVAMARMILTLSAVLFFLSPVFLRAEPVGSALLLSMNHDLLIARSFENAQLNTSSLEDLSIESLARGISFAAVNASSKTVIDMLSGLLGRYPQLKFAFCVTSAGDFVVVEESMLQHSSVLHDYRTRSSFEERAGSPPQQSAAPITAFHIASMTHDCGYYELPRPVPVQPPCIVLDNTNNTIKPTTLASDISTSSANSTLPGPQGQLLPSLPSSPWRAFAGMQLGSYLLVICLPAVTCEN